MDNNIQKSYIDLGLKNVSRETCVYLEKFIDLAIQKHKDFEKDLRYKAYLLTSFD